jgi:predicted ester cyclase
MTDPTRSVVAAFFDEALNQHDLAAFDRFCAEDYVWHGMAGVEVRGLDAFKREVGLFFDAFPDISVEVLDILVGGERAAVRFRESGTHLGGFAGVPPTGRAVLWDGVAIYRVANGLLVEEWSVSDRLAMLETIGGLPRQAD